MKEEKNDLIVGQRYWLDAMKDVSGVYVGYDGHSHNFGEIQGNDCYEKNKDGTVPFATANNFIHIPQ